MTNVIDYYFTSISPFTYLGHTAFLNIARPTSAEIRYKPIKLAQVFANSGAVLLSERPQCRQAYRLLEIERWAKKRNLPVNLHPAHFPTDPALADRCIIALQEDGHAPDEFLGRVLAACWAQEQNIADESVLRSILRTLSIDADRVIRNAQSPEVRSLYDSYTADAIHSGVLGAPAYLLDGEQFWGQDRLELLADSLSFATGATL